MTRWDAVLAAVGQALSGETTEARQALTACWASTTETDHAQRCVIAHYLADLQPTLDEEVAWDETALAAHAHVADGDLVPIGVSSAAGFAPSLHLNLGDGYLRQRRVADARAHLEAGIASQYALPAEGYGALVRSGLERLAGRIEQSSAPQGLPRSCDERPDPGADPRVG